MNWGARLLIPGISQALPSELLGVAFCTPSHITNASMITDSSLHAQVLTCFEAELEVIHATQAAAAKRSSDGLSMRTELPAPSPPNQPPPTAFTTPATTLETEPPTSLSFRTASNKIMLPPKQGGLKRARALMGEADAAIMAQFADVTNTTPVVAPAAPAELDDIPDELMMMVFEQQASLRQQAAAAPPAAPAPPVAPAPSACVHWSRYWRQVGPDVQSDSRFLWAMVAHDCGMSPISGDRTVFVWTPLALREGTCAACGKLAEHAEPADACKCVRMALERTVVLCDEWSDTPVQLGDIVHIVPIRSLGALASLLMSCVCERSFHA